SHSPVLFALFSFLFFVALRDLHSFPTRRSSDLVVLGACPGGGDWRRRFRGRTGHRRRGSGSDPGKRLLLGDQPGRLRGHSLERRSEEHTSELQSRVDLVCRLLLEKKKKRNKQRM